MNSKQLPVSTAYLRHDFRSGYAVGLLLNKCYGERFETRTLENNGSDACARHNWGRILVLHDQSGMKFGLT